MNLKKVTALILATLMIGVVSISCKSRENGEDNKPLTPETVESISPELQQDYTQNAEQADKVLSLQGTFDGVEESVVTDFATTRSNGGLTITAYLGSSRVVRVPSQVNGEPIVAVADGVFAENKTLESLYLPDSVSTLGEGILKGCESLVALRTPLLGQEPDSKQYLGYLFGADTYENNPRDIPPSLQYLELGGNMDKLADFALFDCNDLICITLPETVKTIGSYSLYHCTSLLAINTVHLTDIASHALDSCSSLTKLEFGENLISFGEGVLEGCTSLRSLTLPFVGGTTTENTYLGYLFGALTPEFSKGYYPQYLTSITLSSICTSIGDYAFYECESLTYIDIKEGISSIGIRAFSGCIRLKSIDLPNSLIEIDENAFFGCLSLESILIGNEDESVDNAKLTSIGINAFYNCSALQSIKLPQSLKLLPASCFAGCLSLAKADLGGVESVGKNAFRNCQSLTSLTAISGISFASGNEAAESLLLPPES